MSKAGERVAVALLYPDLLGTYGDSGNAAVLAWRLRSRNFDAKVLEVLSGDPVPQSCDFYVLGGGEDLPQSLAARQLGAPGTGPLGRAVDAGAAVLATCAGLQILGHSFAGPAGEEVPGLGLLDCRTRRGRRRRAVGEVVVRPDASLDLGEALVTGYENHAGITELGPGARPMGAVVRGVGNGGRSGTDGAWKGRVLGTYLHGPVLARNPALADRILSWVVDDLEPLDDSESEQLREERLAAAHSSRRRR